MVFNENLAYFKLIGEFNRHLLMNFHSTSHASIPVIWICFATNNGDRHNFYQWWRKVRQILEIITQLGESWQQYKSQLNCEETGLNKVQTRDITDTLIPTSIQSALVAVSVQLALRGQDEVHNGIRSSTSSSTAAPDGSVPDPYSEGAGRAHLAP